MANDSTAKPLTCPDCPGWDGILTRLAADLRRLGYAGPVDVKEKWGQLRIDIGGALPEVHDRVEAAERESETACHRCGKPGVVRSINGWLLAVCEFHFPASERV